MKLSDFDYHLPEDRIATRPARPRSAARLLLAQGDAISDRHVFDLPAILRIPLSEPLFILGTLFILIVMFLPGGIAGLADRFRKQPVEDEPLKDLG